MPSEIEKKESAANAKTSANKQKAEKKTTKRSKHVRDASINLRSSFD